MGIEIVKRIAVLQKYLIVTMGVFASVLLLQMCVPPADIDAEERAALSAEEMKRRERQCLIALSNATEYFKNSDYEAAIRNYHKLVTLGCGEEYAQDVYLWFGRAYLEIGKQDSAAWAFQQGLRYLPEDKNLLENIAYSLGRLGDTERQLYYYERLLEVDPANLEALRNFADLLRGNESYNDLIRVLNQWLEVEPNNGQVQSELIEAYNLAGKDPLSFMRQRWEENPENPQWGLDYAQHLIDADDTQLAYRTLESIIQRHTNFRKAYELLANAALNKGDVDRAIRTYEKLFQVNRTDAGATKELSRSYLRKREYQTALQWAETALKVSNNSGEAYFVRGDVYYAVADECVSQRENAVATFQDKLVYLMAHEDYRTAIDKGYRRAQIKANFLEKNLIPAKGDWFLQPANLRVFKPQGDCYSWINRTIRRP